MGSAWLAVCRRDPCGRVRVEQGGKWKMSGLNIAGDNKGHLEQNKGLDPDGQWRFKVAIAPALYERIRALAEPEGRSVPGWLTNVMLEAIESASQDGTDDVLGDIVGPPHEVRGDEPVSKETEHGNADKR